MRAGWELVLRTALEGLLVLRRWTLSGALGLGSWQSGSLSCGWQGKDYQWTFGPDSELGFNPGSLACLGSQCHVLHGRDYS